MTESPSLSHLIGMNLARIRSDFGLTLEAVATTARSYGLKWNVARVRELEAGTLGVPVQNLLVLAQVLYDLTGERRQLVDFVEQGARRVKVTPEVEVPTSQVYQAIGGQAVVIERTDTRPPTQPLPPLPAGPLTAEGASEQRAREAWIGDDYGHGLVSARTSRRLGLTDERAAKQLGIPPMEWIEWCAALWKRSLVDERDARMGNKASSSAQQRGHVTRSLIEEMKQFVAEHGGDFGQH